MTCDQHRIRLAFALLAIAKSDQQLDEPTRGTIQEAGEFLERLDEPNKLDEPNNWDVCGYERMHMNLPPWDPSMSDGCSIPKLLIPFFPLTPEQAEGCLPHDEAYYYGGTRAQRLAADARLLIWWLEHGMAVEQAEAGFMAIRVGGGPERRNPRHSWAFGGKRFVYDEE